MASNVNSTYNLSAAAAAIMVDGTQLAPRLVGGTLTVYDGKQPLTADTATSGNNVLATITLPQVMLGIYTRTDILVLDPLPQVPWTGAGTATWVRVKNSAGATMFDCNIGLESDKAELYIDQNPVRIGDVCRIGNNNPTQIGARRKTNLGELA